MKSCSPAEGSIRDGSKTTDGLGYAGRGEGGEGHLERGDGYEAPSLRARSAVPKLCRPVMVPYSKLCCSGNTESMGSSDIEESNIPRGLFLTRCITLGLELCLLLQLSPPVTAGITTFAPVGKAALARRAAK